MKTRTVDRITASQLNWAARNNIELDGSYTRNVEDNVFGGVLHPETRSEYERGKGHELEGPRAHMTAVHSSAALVVNVFDYWRRGGRPQEIAQCCGMEGSVDGLSFEATHPVRGVTRTPPHLDVQFTGSRPLAIESKFTETYHRTTRRTNESTHLDKYLERESIWQGLPQLKRAAEGIVQQSGARTTWEYLDVPQLVKHILGLRGSYHGGFTLLYLWYRIDSPEARQHEQELRRFSETLSDEVSFRTMTYQDLFDAIQNLPGTDPDYLDFLRQRYFSLS